MLKRNNSVHFRLDDKELMQLKSLVKKSGLSQESYLRKLIDGVIPSDAPPPDYHAMMRELFRIGNNINQIAMVANATSHINAERYDEVIREYRQTTEAIKDAVQSGTKYKWKGG